VIDLQDPAAIAAYLCGAAASLEPLREKARADQQVVRRDFSVSVIAGRFQRLLTDVAHHKAVAA
jgi:hypothetical protein